LTASGAVRIIPFVLKTSVIPAAVLAAGFAFSPSSVAEAKHHHKKATPVAATASSAPRSHSNTTVRPSQKTAGKPRTAAKKGSRKRSAEPSGDAVERVAVQTPQTYGPFLPVEEYSYPQPPCSEYDAIIEAHEHEADEDGPEADSEDVASVAPAAVNPLTRVARTLGSWLRPKSAESTVRPEDVDLTDLISAGVQIPVEGVDVSRLKDSFLNSRGQHRQHLAIDIGAPKGTPVLAAADGEVFSLRHEKRGGISLYQKDATGKYLLFYCHLTKYAAGLKPGRKVSKGDVIAYVGRTGHVIGGPHLHFSITRLPEDDDNFKAGMAINPYLVFLAAVP
jgi:murein DD-endopeptidase MepM/ murein hydrolase activator NlpD